MPRCFVAPERVGGPLTDRALFLFVVQALALPAAILQQADVVGGAQTGSGKTLAFGIPIVQALLEEIDAEELAGSEPQPEACSLRALILTPTRELALQVATHLKSLLVAQTKLRAVCIVGGISAQKQKRQLQARPQIVVATPGASSLLLPPPAPLRACSSVPRVCGALARGCSRGQ